MTAISADSMKCEWTDNSSNELGFFVAWANDSIAVQDSTDPEVECDTITNLLENTKYEWLVVAYNADGKSYSNSDTCYTLCDTPTGLDTAWVTNDSVSLYCNSFANDDSGKSCYFFSLKQAETFTDSANSDDSSHVFNGLLAETTYKAYVYYINGDSIRTDSIYTPGYDSVIFTTPDPTIPFFPLSAFLIFAVSVWLVTVIYLKKRGLA